MTLAALYVRVSTEEQAMEGYSLAAQKEVLSNYCIAHGLTVYRVYEDDGFSGRNTRRPGYQQMLKEIKEWDVMIVLKMDRIHRNSRNFMNMMDQLERKDKKFVSATESLDTSNAVGRFVVSMIQNIAQLESEQIGERTYIGMKEKAETLANTPAASRTLGFNPPFGYLLEKGILLAEPAELDTVAGVFTDYLGGTTMAMIAYRLNQRRVLTKRGNPWTVYSVSAVLHNPIYAGYLRWDGLLMRHYARPAVNIADYNRVQQMSAAKAKDPKKRQPKLLPENDFDSDPQRYGDFHRISGT
ncbi:MAG: recombinase family protein [Methanomethylophilus sp.]|nr:recombinase family protein [Methanomethylophilus sp.]MDD4668458.1 recombinase family protein [Methanomethylophilus sp.]